MVPLQDAQLDDLVQAAFKKSMNTGEVVIQQGDISANEFFVVASGEFTVSVGEVQNTSATKKISNAKTVGTIKAGMSFGELALLYQAPRAATVTCSQSGLLW